VSISLDGPRVIHDQNRVFSDGKGSFAKIMENLNYIKKRNPDFFNRISFLNTLAPNIDYGCVNEFYNASEIMEDNYVSVNLLNEFSSKNEIAYDDLHENTYSYQSMKVLLSALGLYSKDSLSKLFINQLSHLERVYEGLSKMGTYETDHPGGPCIPGVMRPFVTNDGTIFPCERVNEESDVMKIGHIDAGFDIDKIENMKTPLNKRSGTTIHSVEAYCACWGNCSCSVSCSPCFIERPGNFSSFSNQSSENASAQAQNARRHSSYSTIQNSMRTGSGTR